MPTRDGYPEGTPAWADLATTDPDAAKAFYTGLFGWEFAEPESESIPYWMAHKNGLPAAGLGPAPDEVPMSVWSTHFAVDNADATAQKVEAAGGQVMFGPDDILTSGRFALCTDPTGAFFGIWQSGDHNGAKIVNEHGAMNWNELQTDDLATALSFYSEVFGHTHETADMPNGPYTALSIGDRVVAGAMPKPAAEIPNNWGVYFAVDDAEAALETAKQLGGKVDYGPMTIPDVGTFVGIQDPTGAHLTLIELAMEID